MRAEHFCWFQKSLFWYFIKKLRIRLKLFEWIGAFCFVMYSMFQNNRYDSDLLSLYLFGWTKKVIYFQRHYECIYNGKIHFFLCFFFNVRRIAYQIYYTSDYGLLLVNWELYKCMCELIFLDIFIFFTKRQYVFQLFRVKHDLNDRKSYFYKEKN